MTFHAPRERPTATLTTGDVSRPEARASAAAAGRGVLGVVQARPMAVVEHMPTSAIEESLLLRGYLGPRVDRTERCACGGIISAPFDDWPEISAEVLVHNSSTVHRRWRDWQEAG